MKSLNLHERSTAIINLEYLCFSKQVKIVNKIYFSDLFGV